MRSFLSDEIQQWLKEPRTVDGVTFQILSRPSGSLFAAPSGPGGGMKIEISYQQDITGIVDGVYFLYKAGPASSNRPIDFVTIRMSANAPATSLAATVATNAAARLLGLVPDFGLPIKLKGNSAIVLPNPAGFTKPPTLQVGIEVSVPGFEGALGDATLEIAPDGTAKIKDFQGITIPVVPPFPLGTTAFFIIAGGFSYDGQTNTLGLKVQISPGAQSIVVLDIDTDIALPLDPAKGITLTGRLLVDNEDIAGAECHISGSELSGRLTVPDKGQNANPPPGLSDILTADFQVKLDQSGLTADGIAVIYKVIHLNLDLLMAFGGPGSFKSSSRIGIDGINGTSTLSATYTKGFKQIELATTIFTEVDLKIFKTDANVEIHASYGRNTPETPATVNVRALGIDPIQMSIMLSDLTLDKIITALCANTDKLLKNVAKAAARWEADKKDLLAKWESHWRDTLHDQAQKWGIAALSVDNGGPIDKLLGGLATDGKRGGQWLETVWDTDTGDASEFINNPVGELKKLRGPRY